MTLPRTVADVLSRHVSFEIESIDRMYLNVYQPRLQHTGGAAGFFVGHRGFTYASSALMAQMTEVFVADLHHFIANHDVPLVHFAKGQRKDDVLHEHLDGHDGGEGVLFVGLGQEKTTVISSTRRRNPVTGAAYAWLVHTSAMVNQFYVYCFDDDFGPYAAPMPSTRLCRVWSELLTTSPCRVILRGIARPVCLQDQRVSRKARRVSGAM